MCHMSQVKCCIDNKTQKKVEFREREKMYCVRLVTVVTDSGRMYQ